MKEYHQFVDQLSEDLKVFGTAPREQWVDLATKYVNGYAADELRRMVNIETRRLSGAFFTNSDLAMKVLDYFKPALTPDSYLYDPACGAGNLLIAASDYAFKNNIKVDRRRQLIGTDQHIEFVNATKLRLETDLLLKNNDKHNGNNISSFRIECLDSLKNNNFYGQATHIFVNPPFNQIESNAEFEWGKGKISAAAIFIDKILEYTKPGTSIIAILPDVLRSGSRYNKWRKKIEMNARVGDILLLGQFDKYADIDVYAVQMMKQVNSIQKGKKFNSLDSTKKKENTLSSLFDIKVGPVVDNRDPLKGPSKPYIISRGLEGWTTQKSIPLQRKYLGKSTKGPFVVVKRTSRTSDVNRAIATVINIRGQVFVDNHLIIVKPKSGLLKDCFFALQQLKDKRTNAWLNKHIRCRHLTVKVLSQLPVWK